MVSEVRVCTEKIIVTLFTFINATVFDCGTSLSLRDAWLVGGSDKRLERLPIDLCIGFVCFYQRDSILRVLEIAYGSGILLQYPELEWHRRKLLSSNIINSNTGLFLQWIRLFSLHSQSPLLSAHDGIIGVIRRHGERSDVLVRNLWSTITESVAMLLSVDPQQSLAPLLDGILLRVALVLLDRAVHYEALVAPLCIGPADRVLDQLVEKLKGIVLRDYDEPVDGPTRLDVDLQHNVFLRRWREHQWRGRRPREG